MKNKKALRHNISYADSKIDFWRNKLASRLEASGVLDLNALDMVEMYSEWKGDWKQQLAKG